VWLVVTALFGLIVPNGYLVYWLMNEYHGLAPVLGDHLAMAFILDCFLAMVLLAVFFAKRPIGPVRWPTFVALSLLGGLGFSLPLYYWMNTRHGAHT
jgi:Na+/H+ antiporter NhaA